MTVCFFGGYLLPVTPVTGVTQVTRVTGAARGTIDHGPRTMDVAIKEREGGQEAENEARRGVTRNTRNRGCAARWTMDRRGREKPGFGGEKNFTRVGSSWLVIFALWRVSDLE